MAQCLLMISEGMWFYTQTFPRKKKEDPKRIFSINNVIRLLWNYAENQWLVTLPEAYLENYTVKHVMMELFRKNTQPAFTCSKLTKETLEQGVKYVQS